MYRPPENSNRVKAIKCKFENNSSDSSKVILKPPLRKSRTLQEFNIKSNFNGNVHHVIEQKQSNLNNSQQAQSAQLVLTRQLSDPTKRNIKRTPAFRLDKNVTEKAGDQKNARLLQNRSRYLDKINKLDTSVQEFKDENNFKVQNTDLQQKYVDSKQKNTELKLKHVDLMQKNDLKQKNLEYKENDFKELKNTFSRAKPNGFGHQKSTELSKINFTDIRSKFNGDTQTNGKSKVINNQKISLSSLRNKLTNENHIFLQSLPKTTSTEDGAYKNGEICNKSDENANESNTKQEEINGQNDKSDTEVSEKLKFLYSEPVPKSQRTKQDHTTIVYVNTTSVPDKVEDVYNSSTLKLCESQVKSKNVQVPVSDDESRYTTKTFIRNNSAYGSLRTKKSLENLSVSPTEIGLTDTLKNALKKPLPKGPAPRKPPRTFLHTPNKLDSPTEISPLNLNKNFTKKLNSELQKNRNNTTEKKSKGDAKYMLDKLETALRNKKVLLRKPKAGNTSEDDSDSEKSKLKFLNLRGLPTIPSCSSSQTLPNLPYSPSTSPKFNFNCLSSLGCTNSAYEAVKEPNSSFFVTHKREEPVYAEPFEYQVDLEEQVKNDEGATDNVEVTANSKTIRHSLHYASSPVPNVKAGVAGNHVSEVKNQDQVSSCDSNSPSSTCTSDMDSIVSTPSEENKSITQGIKVKDLIKAIENNSNNTHKLIRKTNSIPCVKKSSENGINIIDARTEEDCIKRLETQLKNALDKSFSTTTLDINPITSAHSESNISEIEEDGEGKQETTKFETYVKRVRSKIYCRSRQKKEHLFHCCLLVALDRCTPYVKSKYPPKVQEPYKIADLCFPEVENGSMDSSVEAQCYSLIITNEHGERTFGYCRRVLPEASTACLPLAYCILSKHRAPGFYRKILEELEYRHGYPDKFRESFIEELYNCKFPLPGETMIIDCAKIISGAGCDKVKIAREQQSSENRNCDEIYSTNNKGDHDFSVTNSNCDTSVVDYGDVSGRKFKISENDEDNDLKSYVIVCNNGEYGTLIRGNKGSTSNINCTRGNSTIINIPHEIPTSNLRKSTSTPNLLADIESLPSELVLIRPQDSRHEENDLKLLGETLKMPVLEHVFCSLLLERKVILVSCVLGKLSSCIEALQIILYPFSWQHTIIPVLPRSLWEIVDAPTPLVCGVLSSEVVNDFKIENAIVVDLDEGTVLLSAGDEDRILPYSLIQTLKHGLDLANKVTSNKSGAHNVFFSDAFLRVFIQSCGHYKDFIVNGEFQKSEFIQHSRHKGKRIRQFLKWFTETTMFYNFLEIALHDSSSLDLFHQRIKIYTSESATEVLNKMKYWTNYNKSYFSPNFGRFQL